MPPRNRQVLTLDDFRGGRNDTDPPRKIADNQVVEALNVDWFEGALGRKRGGASSLSLTFSSGGPFSGQIASLARHIPAGSDSAAELWAVSTGGLFGRLTGGTTWTAPTVLDSISGSYRDVNFCTFNGKLVMAYDSAQDRLHMWDGSTVRRVGLVKGTTPTFGAKVAGAVTDTRTYKTCWIEQSAGITIRRGELSDASAAQGLAAQQIPVNRPTTPGEGETHWEIYIASTDGLYYGPVYTVAVGTASQNDNTVDLTTFPAEPLIGTYVVPTSAKFVIADGSRMLMAGSWESGGKNNRVWFTPILGTTNVSDAERIPQITGVQNNYIDLDENDGDIITGFAQIQGAVYVFKKRQIWKLIPTGYDLAPYYRVTVSKAIGAIHQKTIVQTFDDAGQPVVGFLSEQGPYLLGSRGLTFIGETQQILWATVNLAASNIVAHGCAYPAHREIWWWVATGASNSPDTKLCYDISLNAFAKHTSDSAGAECSVLFSATVGASMSRDLKPYIGRSSGTAILKCDTGTQDNGTNFQAYFQTRPYALSTIAEAQGVWEAWLLAEVSSGVTITCTITADFGKLTDSSTVTLTLTADDGSATSVFRKFEDLALAGYTTAQFTLGDGSALNSSWVLDEFAVALSQEQLK